MNDTVPDSSPRSPGAPSRLSLPNYSVGDVIGKGGMGEVLLARDPEIGRDVAIKRMVDGASPALLARFMREAKIQARLEHPAIVPVHELGRDAEGRPYFTMKRLTGTTLHDVLQRPPRLPELLRTFVDVCLAIGFAHARGVVHRDLKPANIMVGDFGEVYVLDWGLARVTAEADEPRTSDDLAAAEGLTQAGAMLGTPGYMAPEQVRDAGLVGPAADVYALGCLLFEILAGEPLHPRGDALASTLAGTVRSPGQVAETAPELEAACLAALAGEPAARPTARSLAERVQHYLDGDRDLERRRAKAAEELARARALVADPAQRAEASRLAGHALALDPDSRDAAALVAQLLVEPPPVMPRQLAQRLDALDTELSIRSAGLARFALAGFYLLIPLAAWSGLVEPPLFAVLMGFVTLLLGIAMYQYRFRRPNDLLALACNVGLLALLSRVFGAFVFVPAMVCILGWGLGQQAVLLRHRRLFTAFMVASFLGPFVLEQLGTVAATTTVAGGQLVITSPMFQIANGPTLTLLVVGNLFGILVATTFGQEMSSARRDALREREIQSWHLEQMVSPRSKPGPG
jgi:eukaryotic-like serine/threonine-protein kinase